MSSSTDEPRPAPDPEERRRPNIRGNPVGLGGHTWLLAPARCDRRFDRIRDQLYDDMTIRGKVPFGSIALAAAQLIGLNYDLSAEERMRLLDVEGEEAAALTQAVIDNLIGSDLQHRTYSEWCRSALLANGLDPRAIGPDEIDAVLSHLVGTGRALTADKFISSELHAAERQELLDSVRGR